MSRMTVETNAIISGTGNDRLDETLQHRRQQRGCWHLRRRHPHAQHARRSLTVVAMLLLSLMFNIVMMAFSTSSSSSLSSSRHQLIVTGVNGFIPVGLHYHNSRRVLSESSSPSCRYSTFEPARQTSSSSSSRRANNKRSVVDLNHPTPATTTAPKEQTRQQQQQQQQGLIRNQHHTTKMTTTTRTSTLKNTALLLREAERVEQQVSTALESLRAMAVNVMSSQQKQKGHNNKNTTTTTTSSSSTVTNVILFPTVRECNAALATFGDDENEDLLRALRLFGKMRKAAALKLQIHESSHGQAWMPLIPCPTLVTYSTLMSRAVRASKPRVALRLWDLMKKPTSTSTSSSDTTSLVITPDVKAVNILMNCFAKLGDLDKARQLLEEMKQTTLAPSSSIGADDASSSPSSSNGASKSRSQHSSTLLLLLQSPTVPVRPNLVTYNTFLNACQLAGDLDAALAAKQDLELAGIRPDATTYTTLIATVARKKSCTFGERDPSLAFILLDEMKHRSRRAIDGSSDDRLAPNGKTYSALIDACGRCGRSDLALQGLRIMLRETSRLTKQFQKEQQQQHINNNKQVRFALQNEVGAWTAAINACGKAGRIRTAMRLFYAMPKLGCEPNAVTCGCLTDSLLRAGHVDDALQVLRYMKQKGIVPSEVMYTSLMTRADRLVQMENKKQQQQPSIWYQQEDYSITNHHPSTAADTKAISVYTELMRSLMDGSRLSSKPPVSSKSDAMTGNNSRNWQQQQRQLKDDTTDHDAQSLLLKVFLVFQQMKASGAEPDLQCYNALLRACARAGDLRRGLHVLQEMMQGNNSSMKGNSYSTRAGSGRGLQPNDRSWRELLRAARTGDQAVAVWKLGLGYHERHTRQHQYGQSSPSSSDASFGRSGSSTSDVKASKWKPSAASFAALVAAHLQEADSLTSSSSNSTVDNQQKRVMYARVVALYDGVLRGTNTKLGLDRMDHGLELLDDQRAMMLILRAIVSLDDLFLDDLQGTVVVNNEERRKLRIRATSILQLECFQEIMQSSSQQRRRLLRLASYRAVEKAQSWMATTINPSQVERRRVEFVPAWSDVL
jgi:pentatricopeptide repeat protein